MELLDILRNVWFIIIGFLLLGYSILDGFDLGIGILFPFLAKKEEEKQLLLKAIGPFWDGNEVWLITGGGALFASFPHAYATVFSGFYLALMLVLFSLIFRAVSIEFYSHDEKNKKIWEKAFIIGSFLPSLLFGVALGNVILGVPLNESMNFTGNFFTLLRPYPISIGLLGLNAILLQGSTYAALKTSGEVQERARNLTSKLWFSFIFVFGLSFVMTLFYLPGVLSRILPWIFALVVLTSWAWLKKSLKNSEDSRAFLMSSMQFVGLWGIVGAIHFPNLVRASNCTYLNLTIYNASSTELTLKVMSIIALIGMPLVIAYTIYLYKVFEGKVSLKN